MYYICTVAFPFNFQQFISVFTDIIIYLKELYSHISTVNHHLINFFIFIIDKLDIKLDSRHKM